MKRFWGAREEGLSCYLFTKSGSSRYLVKPSQSLLRRVSSPRGKALVRPVSLLPPLNGTGLYDGNEEEKQKAASQWWVSVLILGGVILAAVIGIILVKKRQKNYGGAYL